MTAEAGHQANRVYLGQDGAIHRNGSAFYNDAEVDISGGLEAVVGLGAKTAVAASTAKTGADETDTAFDVAHTIPANSLRAGSRIRVRAQGIHTATTGSETHTIALKIGGTTVASKASVDPADNDIFYFDLDIVIRTIGSSGTFVAAGVLAVGASGTGAAVAVNKASTAIDTTVANDIAVYIDRQSTATDGDSARLDILNVDIIG